MKEVTKTVKLLYPFANVMGLFFPVGKLEDGGTCEFATENCLKKCCAHAPGAGMKIGFEKKQGIVNYFLNHSPERITGQILAELKDVECKIFTWFASGDCPSFLTEKFYSVVRKLDVEGIIQTGFTRNERLWEKCEHLSENNKILLTIEKIGYATKAGLYSMPNYKIGAIDIVQIDFEEAYVRSGCGGGYYAKHAKLKGKDKSHLKLDCNACYKNKTGCFAIVNEHDTN